MKILLLMFLLTTTLSYAGMFLDDAKVLVCNNGQLVRLYYETSARCVAITGNDCHDVESKNCRYHKIINSEYTFDQSLKDSYDVELAAKASKKSRRKTKREAGDACLKAIVDPDALLFDDVLPTLKCVLKLLDRE